MRLSKKKFWALLLVLLAGALGLLFFNRAAVLVVSRKGAHMKSEVKTKLSITVKSIFFDFTGRPLATADYLTHTYLGHRETYIFSRVTGST